MCSQTQAQSDQPPQNARKRRRSRVAVILASLCVLSLILYGTVRSKGAGRWSITIGTGSEGGTFYPLGCQLAQSLEEVPGKPIREATARVSLGSVENLEGLLAGDVNVAFALGPAIAQVAEKEPRLSEEVAVLTRLYRDLVHVVVRNDAGISSLKDLAGKGIYTGAEKSGTRLVAEWVLTAAGVSPSDYNVPASDEGFSGAIRDLKAGKVDAAFIMAGIPTEAVMTALKSGECKLLGVGEGNLAPASGSDTGLVVGEIPAGTYQNQAKRVLTIGADTFLLARKDLGSAAARLIEETLFDNLEELLIAHTKAHDIRFSRAFAGLPRGLALHPGAVEFLEKERSKLLIATGALNG